MCIGTRTRRHLPARSRHRAADLSRPHARDHDRAVARPRPVTQEKARFPALPEPVPLARFSAADDLRAAIGLWAAWLAGERRASAHTVAAYGRDLAFFLDFLTEHLGELPSLAAISALRPADFRAYLARRARDGIERSSLARGLSVLRGFRTVSAAPRACRDDGARRAALAKAAAQRAEAVDGRGCSRLARRRGRGRQQAMARQARHRDLDAALWLRLADFRSARADPGRGAAGRDAGDHRQGRQTAPGPGFAGRARSGCRLPRRLPVHADQGRPALCRRPRRAAQPAASCSGKWRRCAAFSGSRKPRPRTPCGTALRPIFSAPAAICAQFRNCWVTPACRRPSAILRSRPSVSSPSTTPRIPASRPAAERNGQAMFNTVSLSAPGGGEGRGEVGELQRRTRRPPHPPTPAAWAPPSPLKGGEVLSSSAGGG